MPEINPLTKDQLFEKKIAENTGSNYNVGDISDVVPVTKDQSLLKEIALNSAGLSEDITELEGKVADNTGAIEAIVNEYGSKNLLPFDLNAMKNANTLGTWNGNVYSYNGVDYIVNEDSVTANGTASGESYFVFYPRYIAQYKTFAISGCPAGGSTSTYFIEAYARDSSFSPLYVVHDTGEGNAIGNAYAIDNMLCTIKQGYTASNIIFYPMIRDVRITDQTYVPYAMTNRELTENTLNKIKVRTQDVVWDNGLAEINFGDGKDIAILYVYTMGSADGIIFSVNRVYGNSRFRIKRSDNHTGTDGVDIVYTENSIHYTV